MIRMLKNNFIFFALVIYSFGEYSSLRPVIILKILENNILLAKIGVNSAGMDFHELLDIPQGDRRKYHDDVTVMVISLEGRIWKSSGKYP